MAESKKVSKRKGAIIEPAKTKKAKVERSTANTPKKEEVDQSSETKTKSTRKRAADYFEGEPEKPIASPAKKVKASKVTNGKAKTENSKKMNVKEDEFVAVNDTESNDVALDGFTSSEESNSDFESDGDSIPEEKLPRAPKVDKKIKQEVTLSRKNKQDDDGVGVLYVGRIPHGFYEHQMRHYFSQFGTITRLRLARNRQTGKSKHYAFMEFDSAEVADIVQRVMDKYLMFGHLLQVRRIPQDQVHDQMFKGANTRFKKIPWGDIQARGMKTPAERATWERRVEREEKRREEKKKIFEEYGYDFDMPKLRQVKDLPSRSQRLEENGTKLIEPVKVEDLSVADVATAQETSIVQSENIGQETKKTTKSKKAKDVDADAPAGKQDKKPKKSKKTKASA